MMQQTLGRKVSLETLEGIAARAGPFTVSPRETIVASLRIAILSGSLSPGDRITQQAIADAFGVSRMPVREALRALESEGHIIVERHKSYTVTTKMNVRNQIKRAEKVVNARLSYGGISSSAGPSGSTWKYPMEIKVREGSVIPLNRAQQVWYGDTPQVMQTARFAGQEMVAITDDAGAFKLDYLGHIGSGFARIEDAKTAAPEFARAVLERLRNLILDV